MSKKTMVTATAAMVLAGALVASAMQAPKGRPAASATKTAPSATLPRVADRSLVCMVNDMDMGKAQIPVAVEGRTYYGCCAMCKERLSKDAAVRAAIDPVSGKKVDKAKAVIGKRPDGSVIYFESEKNLREYAARR